MLPQLPNDIYEMIYSLLPLRSHRLLNTAAQNPLPLKREILGTQRVCASRIKLLYKLVLNKRILFKKLNSIFKLSFISSGMLLDGKCIMYSPFVQYGKCRFCNKCNLQHTNYKMIQLYLLLSGKK